MNAQSEQPPMFESKVTRKTPRRAWVVWLTVLAGIIVLMLLRERMDGSAEIISQYTFERLVSSDQIKHATINYNPQNAALNEIVGIYYRTGESSVKVEVPFRAQVRLTPSLESELLNRAEFEPHEPNTMLLNVFFSVLPIVIIAVLIWFFFIRQIKKVAGNSSGAADAQARTRHQQDRLDNILRKWEEQASPNG